jgi:hypothetical protein
MNTEVRVAKRGPKPKKAPDLRRIQEALDRGVKHGTSLYTKGCRCDVCREAVVAAAREYRRVSAGDMRGERVRPRAREHKELSGPLPVGKQNAELNSEKGGSR